MAMLRIFASLKEKISTSFCVHYYFPIPLTKTFEFLKMMIAVISHFPRSQKFLIADRIQNLISDLLECFIEAYYSSPSLKKEKLQRANILLEKLRYYIRLCYELDFYSSKKYGNIMEKIQEIGRMNGGWLKSLK